MQLRRILIVALVVAVFATVLAVGIVELVKLDRSASAPYQIQLVSGPIDTTSFPDITNTTQDPFPDSWYGRIRTWWNKHPQEIQQLKDDSEYVFLLHFYHPALTITEFSPAEEHTPLSFTPIKTYIESKMDVQIGDYVPRSTFLVVCTPPVARNLSSLIIPLSTFNTSFPSNVSLSSPITLYVIPFPDAAKLTGTLLEWNDAEGKKQPLPNDEQKDTRLTVVLLPRTWTKDETDALATEWNSAMKTLNFGARVIVQNETLDRVYIIVDGITTPQHILTIAQWFSHQSQVMIVERQEHFQLFNINAQWIIQSGDKATGEARTKGGRPYWEAGILGQGQIVGAADSGLDWDHCFFADPTQPAPSTSVNTNARKVISYQPLADRTDEDAGHGTHVVGSIAGDPLSEYVTKLPALGNYQGMAPKAQIYFQDVGDSSGSLSGLAGDLYTTIFQPAYRAGARIHSNSWGSAERHYTTNAQSVDKFVWDNPDMLLIFAAGNDGVSAGSVSGNTGSPATAKNLLSVGAEQTSNAGFKDALNYVNWEEKRVAAAQQLKQPVSTFDCCKSTNLNVKAYCCQSYNQENIGSPTNSKYFEFENMAAFSSRGPTADGRVKPEIVAPGSQVISSHSDGRITGASGNSQCNTLKTALLSMEGTSMATPVAAGGAALVRQYLVEGWYPSGAPVASDKIASPRASVIAAIMLASTRSLTGYIDKDNTNDYQSLQGLNYPLNVFQGFGKLELDNALYLASAGPNARRLYIDYSQSLQTGQDINYCLTTTASTHIHAVLVYHDRPAQPNSDPASVNNLDLIVGRTSDDALAGNFVTNRDEKNNAEHVIFPQNGNIGSGQSVYVKVRGWNVPAGPQPYSIAIAGHFDPRQVKSGTACSASNFIISQERFAAATESQYFPYGPVVGGVAGGLTFLGILAILARVCYQKFMTGGTA